MMSRVRDFAKSARRTTVAQLRQRSRSLAELTLSMCREKLPAWENPDPHCLGFKSGKPYPARTLNRLVKLPEKSVELA